MPQVASPPPKPLSTAPSLSDLHSPQSSRSANSCYAPAERAEWEELLHQIQTVQSAPNVIGIYETVSELILILNTQWQIVHANQNLLRLLGITDIAEVYGCRPGEVMNCAHSLDGCGGCGTSEYCAYCGAVHAVLAAQTGGHAAKECHITRSTSSGEALDLLVRASQLQVGGEEFITVAITDISHEKRRHLLESLFFHDLLNVAAGIKGAAELLETCKPAEVPQLHRLIEDSADLLVDEIRATRMMSEAESRKLKIQSGEIQTGEFLRSIAALAILHPAGRNREVRVGDQSWQGVVIADKALLARVVGNMVVNALEAIPEGEVVEVGCEGGGERVRFAVHNSGGMREAVRLQVFKRAYTTKSGGRGPGTYSMKLFGEHCLGGEVDFETSPERGTTFWIDLPTGVNSDVSRATDRLPSGF